MIPSVSRCNLIELAFLDEALRARYLDIDLVARTTLMNFRAAVGRNLDQPETRALVTHLAASDLTFGAWWALHEVEATTSGIKRFRGPGGQPRSMRFESVLSPSAPDQRMIVYTSTTDPAAPPPSL